MIHFVSGGRQFGKTTAMIREAAELDAYIVVPDRQQAQLVADTARRLGVDIPFPITWREFASGAYHGRGIKRFVIDSLDQCIQSMTSVPIVAASLPAVDVMSSPSAGSSSSRPVA
ncbi:hypothetical protein AB0H71_13575 [Nocardia sp. NPDC050697]|uniref:hypothetical protein n=1 Tax=Nocardia sp. NPDC050697 TaxID=3155158 RepID=UPI0034107117